MQVVYKMNIQLGWIELLTQSELGFWRKDFNDAQWWENESLGYYSSFGWASSFCEQGSCSFFECQTSLRQWSIKFSASY